MKRNEGVRLSRIYLVDGPHKGEVVPHEPAHGPYLRQRAVRSLEVHETLYRLFASAPVEAQDIADFFAAQWCSGSTSSGTAAGMRHRRRGPGPASALDSIARSWHLTPRAAAGRSGTCCAGLNSRRSRGSPPATSSSTDRSSRNIATRCSPPPTRRCADAASASAASGSSCQSGRPAPTAFGSGVRRASAALRGPRLCRRRALARHLRGGRTDLRAPRAHETACRDQCRSSDYASASPPELLENWSCRWVRMHGAAAPFGKCDTPGRKEQKSRHPFFSTRHSAQRP